MARTVVNLLLDVRRERAERSLRNVVGSVKNSGRFFSDEECRIFLGRGVSDRKLDKLLLDVRRERAERSLRSVVG